MEAGGGQMNTGQSAVCTRSLGFQFSQITTLTPSPLKTNLELKRTRRLKYRVRRELGVLSIQPKINRNNNTQLLQNSRNFAKKLNETDHFGLVRPEYLGPPTDRTIILYPFAKLKFGKLLSPVPLFCHDLVYDYNMADVCDSLYESSICEYRTVDLAISLGTLTQKPQVNEFIMI